LQSWTRDDERRHQLLVRKARILRARENLNSWCEAAGYIPAIHHRLINESLMALERGDFDRLMIFMPPGAAKSTYGSMLFPAWYLSRHPDHNVMACSHTQGLAERFGRRVRNLIQGHGEELGIEIANDNAAAGRWALAKDPNNRRHNGGPRLDDDDEPEREDGGEYLAAGVGMGIAGFRSDLTIIDDPVKSKEDADSEIMRDKVWDWWLFDVEPRLKPGGKVVLIMTRWHEDDLAGRLLEDEGEIQDGGRWFVLRLPMEANDNRDPLRRKLGERLWPEWFTEAMVRKAKRDPRLWNSLYQQQPTAAEGTFWKREWLRPVPADQMPPLRLMKIYGGSDYATKEDAGDYTVHVIIGLDPDGRPWLLDVWRKQTTSDVWVSAWCDLVLKWRPLEWGEERGQILGGVGPWLQKEQQKRKAHTYRRQFTSRGDKATMARSMQGIVASMGLYYAEDAPWRGDLEAELLAFPAGTHDDIHDALGKTGQLLDMALHGEKQPTDRARSRSGYRASGTTSAQPSSKVA
jgi:predicted phage terminase large subunit-like protein